MSERVLDAEAARRTVEALQARTRQERKAQVQRFAPEPLAWLALAPAWTEELALTCGFPAAAAGGLAPFLSAVETAGFCARERDTESDEPGVAQFWMPERVRHGVLEDLGALRGETFLEEVSGDIGRRLLQAKWQKKIPALPSVLDQWAELAAQVNNGLGAAGRWLRGRIQGLLDAADTGEALAWLQTAKELGATLGGELRAAAEAADRQVQLAYRQRQEERGLEFFVKPHDQLEAFERLLKGPNDRWALHYVGSGGAGKTTLLRFLMARVTAPRGIPTAFVDFDHLNPNYPARRPGQLLLELADKLRAHTASLPAEMRSLFNSKHDDLRRMAAELHRLLGAEALSTDPLAGINHSLFVSMRLTFTSMLSLLSSPVVLILDTCEELTRLQPLGARLPNIEATFSILEAIASDTGNAGLRVVFAGRRLLAQGGCDWRVDPASPAENWAHLPARKPYLQLSKLTGLNETEADQFFAGRQLALTPERRTAVLARSRDTGQTVDVVWEGEKRPAEDPSYNPFNLALYADWLRDDPTLDAGTIAGGGLDPYVEMRIIRRLKPSALRDVLPGIVLLRRFNREMITPLLDGRDLSPDEAYQHLANQEWTDYQAGAAGQNTYLEISPGLYQRLWDYYTHPLRLEQLDTPRGLLVPLLIRLMTTTRVGDLDVPQLDAALRLLPPEQAEVHWDGLAQRIAREADWSWALNVTERLLGAEGAVGDKGHPLRAAVRAVHTAALLHVQPDVNVHDGWNEVAATAAGAPDLINRRWLAARAAIGQAAASFRAKVPPSEAELAELRRQLETFPGHMAVSELPREHIEQLAASLCAAGEAWLEWFEAQDPARLPRAPLAASDPAPALKPDLLAWAAKVEYLFLDAAPALRSFANLLAARGQSLTGHWEDVPRLLAQAETQLPAPQQASVQHQWADWLAPGSLRDRVRLELLRHISSWYMERYTARYADWQREAKNRLNQMDAERLVSRIVLLRLARGVVPQEELDELQSAELARAQLPPERASCAAHRETPPLSVALAHGWLACGRGDRALNAVSEGLRAGQQQGIDRTARVAANQVRAQIYRRLRLPGWSEHEARTLEEERGLEALAAALQAVNGPPNARQWPQEPVETWTPELVHAWWYSRYALTTETARQAVAFADRAFKSESLGRLFDRTDYEALLLQLDDREATLLSHRLDQSRESQPPRFDPRLPPSRSPLDARQAARVMLREEVLWDRSHSYAVNAVGVRGLAEVALEEGEMLALRLPDRGLRLLDRARDWFQEAGDPVGATQAGIRGLIAATHAGEPRTELETRLAQLRRHYEAIRLGEGIRELPPWPGPEEGQTLPAADRLAALDHPVWVGWLLRLARCTLFAVNPLAEQTLEPAARAWLAERCGTPLPAELDLEPADRLAPKAPLAWGTIALRSLSVVAAFGFLGVLVLAVLHLLGTLPPGAMDTLGLVGTVLGAGFLGLATLGFVLLGLDELRSRLGAGAVVQLNLTTQTQDRGVFQGPTRKDLVRILLRVQELRLHLLTLSFRPRPAVEIAGTTLSPGVVPYRAAAPSLPDGLRAKLASLQRRLQKRSLAVPLHVDAPASFFAWEGLLALALQGRDDRLPPQALRFYRAGPPLRRSAAGRSAADVITGRPWEGLAERSWRALGVEVAVHGSPPPIPRTARHRVLHLIGKPEYSSAGWQFCILRDESTYLAIDALPFRLYDYVVVQAEPVAALVRQDSDREQVSWLRGYASEVFAAGAAAVIVLPPLTPPLAEAVLEPLREALFDGSESDLPRLLELIEHVRHTIRGWQEKQPAGAGPALMGPEEFLELAFDVCLFARPPVPEEYLGTESVRPWKGVAPER